MGLFEKLFRRNREEPDEWSRAAVGTDNPAFQYVRDEYSLDVATYIKSASMLHAHAHASADEFAPLISAQPTDTLVHFFFDWYLASVADRIQKRFPDNNDMFSAIVDGIHLEYYGDVSGTTVESILHLWAANQTCFLKTLMPVVAGHKHQEMSFVVTIAAHCTDNEVHLGATEALKLVKEFQRITRSKRESISVFLDTWGWPGV